MRLHNPASSSGDDRQPGPSWHSPDNGASISICYPHVASLLCVAGQQGLPAAPVSRSVRPAQADSHGRSGKHISAMPVQQRSSRCLRGQAPATEAKHADQQQDPAPLRSEQPRPAPGSDNADAALTEANTASDGLHRQQSRKRGRAGSITGQAAGAAMQDAGVADGAGLTQRASAVCHADAHQPKQGRSNAAGACKTSLYVTKPTVLSFV